MIWLLATVPDPSVSAVHRSGGHAWWQFAIAWTCIVIGAVAFAVLVAGSRK